MAETQAAPEVREVNVPGVGPVNFPASMSDAEVAKVIKEKLYKAPAPQPSMAERAYKTVVGDDPLRQFALGSRALAKGIMFPVNAVMDLPTMMRNQVAGMMGGERYPTPSQNFEAALTGLGAPTPQSHSDEMVAAINEGGGAAASVPAVQAAAKAQAVVPGLLQSVQSGAIGAGASEYLRQKDFPLWAQIAGGMLAPMGVDALRVGAKGIWQAMLPPAAGGASPYTQGGREMAAGNVLARNATTPGATAERLAAGVDAMPGTTQRTAEVAQDVGLAKLDKLLQTTRPGYAGTVLEQEGANNRVLREALDRSASAEAAAAGDAAAKVQTAGRTAMVATGTAVPQEVGGVLRLIETLKDSKAAVRNPAVGEALEEVRKRLYDRQGKLITDPDRLDAVRGYVSDLIAGNFDQQGKQFSKANQALHPVLERLKTAVDAGVRETPGLETQSYSGALRAERAALEPVNQRNLIQDLLNKGSSKADILPGGASATAGENYRLVLSKLSSALANERMASKAERILSDDQLGTIGKVVSELERGAKLTSMQRNRLGSDTMQNLSSAALFGRILGVDLPPSAVEQAPDYVRKVMGWIANFGGGPQEKTLALVEAAMQDPKLAAELLKKAPAANLESVGQALGRKSREYAVSGARAGNQQE